MENLKKQTKKKLWTKNFNCFGLCAYFGAVFVLLLLKLLKLTVCKTSLKKANETYQSESVEKE